MNDWQHGTARFAGQTPRTIRVWCPFEDDVIHEHPRANAGSSETLAGCHRAFRHSRSYSVPELQPHNRTKR